MEPSSTSSCPEQTGQDETKREPPAVAKLIDVDLETDPSPEQVPIELPKPNEQTLNPLATEEIKNSLDGLSIRNETKNCDNCVNLLAQIKQINIERSDFETRNKALQLKLDSSQNELEREVQKRIDLEQRFTEEAKRTSDQIEELIVKSDQDDAKLNDLKKKFEAYSRETSSMIENFTTNREILTSQLLDLRKENDFLLGKYVSKARDLQSEEINLPQSVEELQFHCLTLNEKLILTSLAKERLEETVMRNSTSSALVYPTTPQTPTTT